MSKPTIQKTANASSPTKNNKDDDHKTTTTTTTSTTELSAGQAAARGTIMTLVLRLFSFILSQYTFRMIQNPEILGKANIQLELILTTVLFVSREGFRLSMTKNLSP
eukprot:CAMPEP_0119549682 /NCGR_PEP_ID=MMETSP1352-20130426/3330_1 /TAXON_ID=265584 /ORGANISM="Stauroneis constricta, Strain CCMP1120" /LENGTH=106 /DNA_ID=CAMNT_0007595285 /DNA_START=18 /DNA_END=334 /DNA_ORIENTATION=-